MGVISQALAAWCLAMALADDSCWCRCGSAFCCVVRRREEEAHLFFQGDDEGRVSDLSPCRREGEGRARRLREGDLLQLLGGGGGGSPSEGPVEGEEARSRRKGKDRKARKKKEEEEEEEKRRSSSRREGPVSLSLSLQDDVNDEGEGAAGRRPRVREASPSPSPSSSSVTTPSQPSSVTRPNSTEAPPPPASKTRASPVREIPLERKTVASEVSQDLDELGEVILQIRADVVFNQRILFVAVALAGAALLGVVIKGLQECTKRRQDSSITSKKRSPVLEESHITKVNLEEAW